MSSIKQKKKSSRKHNANKSSGKHALSVLRYKDSIKREQKQAMRQAIQRSNGRSS